jgi:polysaccharide biosynthesis protein PslE
MNTSSSKKGFDDAAPMPTMRDIVSPLFRHWRLVAGAFCVLFLGSILLAWCWASRYYVAKMQVVVEPTRSDPAITSGQSAATPSSKSISTDQISSEIALLKGQDMFRSVVETCGLVPDVHWSPSDIFLSPDPERKRAMSLERAALEVANGVKVEAEKTSNVINVKYGRTGNPEAPACVLQNLSKLYLGKHLLLRRPAGSSDFFAEQAEKYHRDLQDVELQLANFGRDEGVAAPDILRTNMAQQVVNSVASLYQTRQAIAADEQRLKEIAKQLETTTTRTSTQEISNPANSLLQELQGSLLAAQIKRTQLLAKYDPSYPLVQEADQEIAATETAITKAQDTKYVVQTTDRDPTYEFLREDMAKTQTDLASQKATAAAISQTIDRMNLQMVNFDAKAVKQGALLREAKVDEGNYLLYASKREQERTSDALDEKRIADVAIAVPPVTPVLPAYGPFLVILIGFFVSAIAGITSAFVADYMDPSFRTPKDVLDALNIPVLASVPRKAA